LQGIREEELHHAYALVLEFDSPMVSFETWEEKRDKMERFFGPGLKVELSKLEDDRVDVALIAAPTQE
jgi:hypothetical protein